MSSISASRSSSRLARYSGDSFVKLVCRNVPSIIVFTIALISTCHSLSGTEKTQSTCPGSRPSSKLKLLPSNPSLSQKREIGPGSPALKLPQASHRDGGHNSCNDVCRLPICQRRIDRTRTNHV